MAPISALQASLLLTEEQRATDSHNRLPHTCPSLTTTAIIHLTHFHSGKHRRRRHCLLFGHSYGNLWHLNNNKCISASGFYDYSVHQLHTPYWTKHIYYRKPSYSVYILIIILYFIYRTSIYSMFPVLDVSCTNNYWSDVVMHDKLSS